MALAYRRFRIDHWLLLIFLTAVAVFYAVGLRAIWSNQWVLQPGDGCVRALAALTERLDIRSLWTGVGLSSPWPKGHMLLTGTLTRWLAHGGDTFTAIHWYQTLSWTAYLAGVLLFSRLAWVLYGLRSGLVTLVLLCGFSIGLDEAATGMTEVYAFLLMGCSTLSVVTAIRRNNPWLIYLGALANLLASTMRTEVILIAFLQWLLLIGRVRILHLLAFGFFSSVFFLTRLGYSTLLFDGSITFLNSNKMFFAADASGKTATMLGSLNACFGTLAAVLVTYALCVWIFQFMQQRRSAKETKSVRGIVPFIRHAATSPEWFPVRCMALLLLFMAAGLRSGSLEALPRYWMALMPYFCLVGAALFSFSRESRMMRVASGLAFIAVLAFSISNLTSAWRNRTQFQAGELAFIQWLRERPENGVVFDNMGFRDGRYIVYASHLETHPLYWGHGCSNPFKMDIVKLFGKDRSASQTLRLAQSSFLQPQCNFLVLARDDYFNKLHPPTNKRRLNTYFRGDIVPLSANGDCIQFKSSVLPKASAIFLKRVYSNNYVDVFEKTTSSRSSSASM